MSRAESINSKVRGSIAELQRMESSRAKLLAGSEFFLKELPENRGAILKIPNGIGEHVYITISSERYRKIRDLADRALMELVIEKKEQCRVLAKEMANTYQHEIDRARQDLHLPKQGKKP